MAETVYLKRTLKNAIDTECNLIGVIDQTHHKVHAGKHFIYSAIMTATASTDAMNVFIKAGNSTDPERHYTFEISADKAGAVYLQEVVEQLLIS